MESKISGVIESHWDQIVHDSAKKLKYSEQGKYQQLESEEIQFIVEACLDSLRDYSEGSAERLRRFNERLSGLIIPKGLSLAEAQRTFFVLASSVRSFLYMSGSDEAKEVFEALEILERVISESIQEFSTTYQNHADKIRASLFLSAVHDVRQPLTSLLSLLDLVRMSEGCMLSEVRGDLDDARLCAERVSKMICTIIDSTRLNEGKLPLNFERLILSKVIPVLEHTMGGWIRKEGKSLEIEIPAGLEVVADHEILLRVLENLVSNAIKHISVGGLIAIRAKPSASGVEIVVEDNGEGLPPSAQDQLFERFSRVEGQQLGSPTDSGWGLMFCRQAVEAMGGKIEAGNREGGGCEVRFTLPIEGGASKPAAAGQSRTAFPQEHPAESKHAS